MLIWFLPLVSVKIRAREIGVSRSPSRLPAEAYSGLLGSFDDPVVPILYVEDAARAVAWDRRLGFVKEWEHQF
jgi:hypothetical protein